MNANQTQQGDVLIVRVDKLPDKAKEIKHDGVIMHGETGHKHRLEDIENVSFFEKDGKFYFQVKDRPAKLVHEEHKPHTYEPGIYLVGQVVEKDWLSGMINRVID